MAVHGRDGFPKDILRPFCRRLCRGAQSAPAEGEASSTIRWMSLPPPDQATFRAQNGLRPGEEPLPALSVMLSRALDMLDCALLIVTDEGAVEYRNRLAGELLRNGQGGLRIAGGVLSAHARDLREALAEAIRLACTGLQPGGLCLSQPGVPSERWLRLAVAPVYFGGPARCATRAAVWIVNNGPPALPTEELLGALFGLTRAEARLARGVLTGCTAGRYARQVGVRMATIRSQLHSIFVKTGVTRQAELVALLSRVPALQFAAH
jgi:DNA-binding CsgD family transcriptional regulator